MVAHVVYDAPCRWSADQLLCSGHMTRAEQLSSGSGGAETWVTALRPPEPRHWEYPAKPWSVSSGLQENLVTIREDWSRVTREVREEWGKMKHDIIDNHLHSELKIKNVSALWGLEYKDKDWRELEVLKYFTLFVMVLSYHMFPLRICISKTLTSPRHKWQHFQNLWKIEPFYDNDSHSHINLASMDFSNENFLFIETHSFQFLCQQIILLSASWNILFLW